MTKFDTFGYFQYNNNVINIYYLVLKGVNQNMRTVVITNHAIERAKERCGFNKKAALRMANKAVIEGISLTDAKGSVAAWVIKNSYKYGTNRKIYLFGDKAWVYSLENENTVLALVTILQIPNELIRKVRNLKVC